MDAIKLTGVRTHNLKNFDLQLAHQKIHVITGVSGSGKSSLAFDTLYAEGQRRYVESLSAYVRQFLERMEKPDIESVSGMLPSISIQSRNVITNARSTVGTQTEINDYLRLLFSRVGQIVCPECKTPVKKDSPQSITEYLLAEKSDHKIYVLFEVNLGKQEKQYKQMYLKELIKQGFARVLVNGEVVELDLEESLKQLVLEETIYVVADRLRVSSETRQRLVDSLEAAYRYGKGKLTIYFLESKTFESFSDQLSCSSCQKEFPIYSAHSFSFNSPLGACPTCQGFGRTITIDRNLVIPDPTKTLAEGAIEPWTKPSREWEFDQLKKYCKKAKIPLDVPFCELSPEHQRRIFNSEEGYMGVNEFFKYLEKKTYRVHVRVFLSRYRSYVLCPTCQGSRLKAEALMVYLNEKTIFDLTQMSIQDLFAWIKQLVLSPSEKQTVEAVLMEIVNRLDFLCQVGLGYLTLDRLSRTLSGGEAQRIHLASSLGSSLVDTLYVLDEPSIGLHERDNHLLIGILKRLRDLGNTVVVVEHDRSMMEIADNIIDLGPNAGDGGGEIIFQGRCEDLLEARGSLTARYLKGQDQIELDRRPDTIRPIDKHILIRGAKAHNLKNIDVEIPLGKFVVVTGVSGSGKSSLIYDVLYKNYLRHTGKAVSDVGEHDGVEGLHRVSGILLVDQSPIGRTPRSNPITYLKAFDEIRKVFASTQEARLRGLGVKHFSFNVDGGRCAKCLGDGQIKVEMHFLADVYVICDQCQGTRYKPQVLEVKFRGKNIHDVLNMTIDEAVPFFNHVPLLIRKLQLLQSLGLGYLRLGQPATTLSQGEGQRLKLAVEMMDNSKENMLYLLDEPTTGLHYHDIHYLMNAFADLLERGHSIVVIEHNLDVIRCADHVIDLGPEGGQAGGEIVFSGDVKQLMVEKKSYTGQYLKKYIQRMPVGSSH